ncbi:hypothetical protein [Methyloterricola oryzae]|uniref:hypothetical protein n=1 Tax=Methyloterricola oryzae TaxID=1495050 RepID=UPI0011AFBE22|nr:hypothetical protein [Methyloterricola oryzae]
MQQEQAARVSQKSGLLHTALGVPLAAAQAAADQVVAEERSFMKSLLLPQLQGADDFPEQLDQLLYRYADAQFEAWLNAVSSHAPTAQSAPHLAGPDSDLLNPDVEDIDAEGFSYADEVSHFDEPHGLLDAGEPNSDEAPPSQDLVPDLPFAESTLTDSQEEDLVQESPEANDTPLDVFEDVLQASFERDQADTEQEPVMEKPSPRTQEEIDADIAASLRELEAAMGEIPHTTSVATEEEDKAYELDLTMPTPLLDAVADDLEQAEESVNDSEAELLDDALPGEADDEPTTTPDYEEIVDLQAEPAALERQALPSRDQELDALLSEPWGQPEAEVDLASYLSETDPQLETPEFAASDETEPLQSDTFAMTTPTDEPVYLAESVDTLLGDLWGEDGEGIAKIASIDDSESAEDAAGTFAEITDSWSEDPDGPGKALEDDISDLLATPGDAIAADEALFEGLRTSEATPHEPANSSAEAPTPGLPVEESEIDPEPLLGIDAELRPAQQIPDPAESAVPEKKRATRKSKPRGKKKKSPEPADSAGSKD